MAELMEKDDLFAFQQVNGHVEAQVIPAELQPEHRESFGWYLTGRTHRELKIILDCSALERVSDDVLGVIARRAQRTRQRQGLMVICVRPAFLTKFRDRLPCAEIVATLEEARNYFQPEQPLSLPPPGQ